MPVTSRVCFVKFQEPESVGVSQHLTNTVFVDRALIVVPFAEGLLLRCSLGWVVHVDCVAWLLTSEKVEASKGRLGLTQINSQLSVCMMFLEIISVVLVMSFPPIAHEKRKKPSCLTFGILGQHIKYLFLQAQWYSFRWTVFYFMGK